MPVTGVLVAGYADSGRAATPMKRAIKHLLNKFGYEVHNLSWFPTARRGKMMERLGINLVLDVGANNGGYASELRRNGYRGRIWSYEPLSEAFADLSKSAARDDLWKTVNCACGAKAGSAEINVAKNSWSSSLLPMLDAHSASAPDSTYVSGETISVCTLDESVIASLSPEDRVWLKIDTQGYEAEVLKGALGLMPRVSGLECELSLVPLYEGQPLVDQMISMIYQLGFRMVGVAPAFFQPDTGDTLQIDGTFLRN
jgi:FkbM family methyltransferase